MQNQAVEQLRKEQELHRKQMQENRNKVMERKKRAHRLIVRGAIAEALVDSPETMTDEEFKQELKRLLNANL